MHAHIYTRVLFICYIFTPPALAACLVFCLLIMDAFCCAAEGCVDNVDGAGHVHPHHPRHHVL